MGWKWLWVALLCLSAPASSLAIAGAEGEPVIVGINVLVLDDGLTTWAQGATFDGPQDVAGQADPALKGDVETLVLSHINSIYAPCGIRFELKTIQVVRPELLPSALRPEKTLADIFSGAQDQRVIELSQRPQLMDELGLFTLAKLGEADVLGLYRQGPHLHMFVSGADLVRSGEPAARAEGQVGGRHSLVTLPEPVQGMALARMETIAHEWGHNLGLLHDDQDPLNLMYPAPNPDGEGKSRLTEAQCATALGSPLLLPSPSNRTGVLRVPEEYASLQAAIGAAAPGATVQVSAGTYDESIFIDKPLYLVADEGTQVFLNPSSRQNLATFLINSAAGVRVEGFSISGDGVVVRNSVDVFIEGNDVFESRSHGIYAVNARVNVERNVIRDHALRGVLFTYALDGLIEGNTIIGNKTDSGAGISLARSTLVRIRHNTISENLEGIAFMAGNINIEIVGNLIQNNEDYGLALWLFEDPALVLGLCSDNDITGNRVDVSPEVPARCMEKSGL